MVIVDATNPLNDTYSDVTTGGTSHAEQLAAVVDGIRVVEALNTVFASRLVTRTRVGNPLDGF